MYCFPAFLVYLSKRPIAAFQKPCLFLSSWHSNNSGYIVASIAIIHLYRQRIWLYNIKMLRSVCTASPQAKYFPVRPSHWVNKYISEKVSVPMVDGCLRNRFHFSLCVYSHGCTDDVKMWWEQKSMHKTQSRKNEIYFFYIIVRHK